MEVLNIYDPVTWVLIIGILVAIGVYMRLWGGQERTRHEAADSEMGMPIFQLHDDGSVEYWESVDLDPDTGERTIRNAAGKLRATIYWPQSVLVANAGATTGDPLTGAFWTTVDPITGRVANPMSFEVVKDKVKLASYALRSAKHHDDLQSIFMRPLDMFSEWAKSFGETSQLAKGRMSGVAGWDMFGMGGYGRYNRGRMPDGDGDEAEGVGG